MKRLLGAVPAALLALSPVVGTAATPTPSPTLDTVLVAAPAGFVKVTNAFMHGRFTTAQYTKDYGEQAVQAEHQLIVDGFVDGYGLTWSQKTTKRTIVQWVIAFAGGAGARSFLDYEQGARQARTTFKGNDPLPGVDPYYGQHFASGSSIGDIFTFVKGNDLIAAMVSSPRNDNLKIAAALATSLYNSAPPSTIPSDQWPENAKPPVTTRISPPNLTGVLPFILIAALVVGLAAIGAGLVMRVRRWRKAPPSVAVQLSPDGTHWWDGHAWRDSAREAPPFAQRSGDGGFWWDGHTWRPVPASGGS